MCHRRIGQLGKEDFDIGEKEVCVGGGGGGGVKGTIPISLVDDTLQQISSQNK